MDLKETLGYTSRGLAYQAFDVPAEPFRPPIDGVDGAVRRKDGPPARPTLAPPEASPRREPLRRGEGPALAVGPVHRPWEGIRNL